MDIFHALLMSVKPNKQTVFSYEIDTTKDSSHTTQTILPFPESGYFYPDETFVDWGDNTTTTYPALSSTGFNRTHDYSVGGVYTITITCNAGMMPYFSAYNMGYSTYGQQITKILTPFMKMVECSYTGVISDYLGNIGDGSTTGQDAYKGTFYNMANLSLIPDKLFKYCPNFIGFHSTFNGCVLLQNIPNDLFKYIVPPIVNYNNFPGTTISLQACFYNCSSLLTIPTNLIRNKCINSFGSMFGGCSSLTSIPSDIFVNCEFSVGANDFRGGFLFNACTEIVTVGKVFNNCTAKNYDEDLRNISIERMFYTCVKLETLDKDLLRGQWVNYVNNVSNLCRGCPLLSGNTDGFLQDIFKDSDVSSLDSSYVFYGCNKLQLSANIFYENGITDRFSGASSVNFDYFIYRTSFTGTQGTAPDLWNQTGITSVSSSSTFAGSGNSLTSLTNYADIPTAWGGNA